MKENDYSYCQVIGITDRGLKRAANEDWLGDKQTCNGWVAVVCDGMGGHVGGATASHIAVDAILDYLSNEYFDDPRIAIGKAIDYANAAIRNKVAQSPELEGMGSTCVLLIVRDGKVYLGHVGDSRIYLIRDHRIHQLTKDHSYVQMLVDMGEITSDQAEHHPRKNEITNALGIPQMQPATVMQNPIDPQAGDCFLLCSDGLSGMVENKTIEHIISQQKQLSAQERATKLIEKAKEGGGLDNITVQLVEFGATPTITAKEHKNILKQWWFWVIVLIGLCGVVLIMFFLIPRSHNEDSGISPIEKKETRSIPLKNIKARSDTVMLLTVNGTEDTCSIILKDASNVYLETLNNVIWRNPVYQNSKIVINYEAMPVEGKINGVVRLINPTESAFYINFEAEKYIYVVEVDIEKPKSVQTGTKSRNTKRNEASTHKNGGKEVLVTNDKEKSDKSTSQHDNNEPQSVNPDSIHIPQDSIAVAPAQSSLSRDSSSMKTDSIREEKKDLENSTAEDSTMNSKRTKRSQNRQK